MKINFLFTKTLLLFVFLLANQTNSQAIVGTSNALSSTSSVFDLPGEDIIDLDKKQLAEKMNRELTWKEKMAISWVKRKAKKAKKNNKRQQYDDARTDGMAIAGLVTGILGICFGISLVFAILGIVFSATAIRRIRRRPELKGNGLATAGLILGIVGVALFVGIVGLLLVVA